MNYSYKTFPSTFIDELGNVHNTYGIAAYTNDAFVPTLAINDIFCEHDAAETFAKLCTKLGLCPDHLEDAVTDALCA